MLAGRGSVRPLRRRVEHEVAVVTVRQRRQVVRLEGEQLGAASVENHRVAL